METGVPIYAAAARRVGGGRYRCRVVRVPDARGRARAASGSSPRPRRSRRRFETLLADAPEQWWGAFHPIWPDLDQGAAG